MLISELKLKPVSSDLSQSAEHDHVLPRVPGGKLPVGIGPHENKEIGLMLSGGKPMALMSSDKYRRNLQYIRDAGFITMPTEAGFLVAQRDYGSEMRLASSIIYRFRRGEISAKRYHISLGKLLGYTDAEIRAFLSHIGSLSPTVR